MNKSIQQSIQISTDSKPFSPYFARYHSKNFTLQQSCEVGTVVSFLVYRRGILRRQNLVTCPGHNTKLQRQDFNSDIPGHGTTPHL